MILFTTMQGEPMVINGNHVIKIFKNTKTGNTCVKTIDNETVEVEETMHDVLMILGYPPMESECNGNCEDCQCENPEKKKEPKSN